MARPILLNSCAKAATAAEARFRIDVPIPARLGSRIVALDAGARVIVRRLAAQNWGGPARFLFVEPSAYPVDEGQPLADMILLGPSGAEWRLSDQLLGADMMVMIATTADGAHGAAVIGEACTLRGIMTAGLVVGQGDVAHAAVSILRPYARVLMATSDDQDVTEVLTALRV